MASSKKEGGMWTCSAGELRNFEGMIGRRFSAQDIRTAADAAVLAAWKAFRQSLEVRSEFLSDMERPLTDGEYRISVTCIALPPFVELEKEFGKRNVSNLFDSNCDWQIHSSCVEVGRVPGERIMLVKCFKRNTTSEANITEMYKLGYRPATHFEAYAFAKANPELCRRFWIVALGSSALRGGECYVAMLGGDSDRCRFDYGWFGNHWYSSDRFLFVRK